MLPMTDLNISVTHIPGEGGAAMFHIRVNFMSVTLFWQLHFNMIKNTKYMII